MANNKFGAIGFATLMCLILVFLGCPPPPVGNRIVLFYYPDMSDSMNLAERERMDAELKNELAHNSKLISKIPVVKFGTKINPTQVKPETFEFPSPPECKPKKRPEDLFSNANERMKQECGPKEEEYARKVQEVMLGFKNYVAKEEPEPECTNFKEVSQRLKMDNPTHALIKSDGYTECRDRGVEKFELKGKLVIIQLPSENPQDFGQNTQYLEDSFPKAVIIKSTEVDSVKRAMKILLGDLKKDNN